MNSRELEDFRLGDAVKFHDSLNPALFQDDKLRPEVRERMLEIARDFMDHLGVKNVEVKDITLSGSNAAFTYTPHSDVDIHILVDMDRYANDEVYRELFNSKKVIYNDTHDIKIHGYDVELYVQDTAEPVKSLGEYSIERDRWIKFPGKTRANLDERATREKFKRLVQLSQLALASDDIDDVDRLLNTIKRYRQAGLDEHGEFGPENLAYKALRSRGIIQQLYDHRDQLHSQTFDLQEGEPDEYAPPGAPDADVERIRGEIQRAMKVKSPLVWKRPRDLGQSFTDAQLIAQGLRKSKQTGNWAGTQDQWNRLYSTNKLTEQPKYPELAPYKEIQFVCAGPEYEEILRDVETRLFYLLKSIPGVIPVYHRDDRGRCHLSAVYKDINLRPEILKLARQLGISVDTERRVSWEYAKQAQRDISTEDYDPNGPPPGPEFKPTMPAGTVRVDVSDVYDWYKLGQHISDMGGLGKHDFGQGPPSTIMAFGDEDLEHKYIDALKKTGLDTTDIDPKGHEPMKGQKVDPTFNVNEKIYPEVAQGNFHAEKDIDIKGLGPLKLKAFNHSTVYPQQFKVEVYNSDNIKIGYFRFVVHDYDEKEPKFKIFSKFKKQQDPYLVAGNAVVWDEYQKKGIASEVYKWVRSMGNDIKPSPYQSDAGKAMWSGFAKSNKLDNTIQETINFELWKSGRPFQSHFATIGGYEFEARPGIREPGTDDETDVLMILARDPKRRPGRQLIGHAEFAVKDHGTNQWLESDETRVDKKYQGKNIAYMMYAFAKSLGNDISPSFAQTTMGKKMWTGWGKDAENLVGEDLTLQFAAEKTPAINPYGGLKDKQFRGAISEMPDTSGPVGVQPGGWRTYKPRNIEVDEAFNQPYMLKWERGQFGDIDAYVKLPDGTNLSIMFNKETNKMWHVEFHRGESQEVTKQGDSLRIFGTVLGAIQQFVKRVKPKYIKLLAVKDTPQPGQKTPDRPGLYDNLINRYAPAMGYTVKRRENPGTVVWEFAKIKSVAEGASGYIPSNSEKNDPRFKTALTVDIKPDSIKRNAKKLGLGNIHRSGIPQTARSDGKFK